MKQSRVLLTELLAIIARNWLYVDGGEVTFEGNGSAAPGSVTLWNPG